MTDRWPTNNIWSISLPVVIIALHHHVDYHMLHLPNALPLVSTIQATLFGDECHTLAWYPCQYCLLEDWALGGERGHLSGDPGVAVMWAAWQRAGDGGAPWEEREADDDITSKGMSNIKLRKCPIMHCQYITLYTWEKSKNKKQQQTNKNLI